MTESVESGLAQTLRQLASETAQVKLSGIATDITNEQLSSLADISFFTAARILSKWEQDRKLCKERGRHAARPRVPHRCLIRTDLGSRDF